ncbi:nucleotide sugar dehydrogenase [Sunxiuqinia dokdonensis]|uniref:Nucleotide sugar dehydrogenase n=1 Tax=Sunxiuqinia dokdonensis TaxID=1409788 RepID=A0A0L8VF80_9BACT|nr:nucleotide sugar dehydrogenase [Sunxiuqinia dokdonensis]KOH47111.1 nucleotide sugar dehydrogenase [Sunxiuqinia dokdonensis]
MTYKQKLLDKIAANTEVVGIIGLGYVGLPLAVNFAEAGTKVIGFDINPKKVEQINHGDASILPIRDAALREVAGNIRIDATTDFRRIIECDALLICVPTPLDRFQKPDMSHIENACTEIGRYMKPGTFISLESTTYPTTTEDLVLPLIEESSKQNKLLCSGPHPQTTTVPIVPIVPLAEGDEESRLVGTTEGVMKGDEESRASKSTEGVNTQHHHFRHGTDFWLAYSPERVDPGNKTFHTRNTPKVLGAMTADGLEIGQAVYRKAIDHIHPVRSPRVAEMVKILENTYRLVNISLINELALLAGKMDINIWEVIEAAKTKPFGFQAFYPGPGIGGHCIPLDPFYLEHIAKQYNFDLSMIHAAGHINTRMPHYMYIKIATALNRHQKSVNGSLVFFLGVAYKPNIDDARESPALKIMDLVAHKGGQVQYHDPYIPSVQTQHGASLDSIPLTTDNLTEADVVVLTTNHDAFDIAFIQQHARLIVDMRNMIPEDTDNIYKL